MRVLILCLWLQDEPNNPIKQDTKKGKLRNYPYNINWQALSRPPNSSRPLKSSSAHHVCSCQKSGLDCQLHW